MEHFRGCGADSAGESTCHACPMICVPAQKPFKKPDAVHTSQLSRGEMGGGN